MNGYVMHSDQHMARVGSQTYSVYRDMPGHLPPSSRLAIGSFKEEYTNRIQVLGMQNDSEGYVESDPQDRQATVERAAVTLTRRHAQVEVLADALHPYPATKIGFQPSDDRQTAEFDAMDKSQDPDWMHPETAETSRSMSSTSSLGSAFSAEDPADLSQEDPYPSRDLLASSADCLHVWEMERNEDVCDMYGAMSIRPSLSSKKHHEQQQQPAAPRYVLREKCALAHAKSSVSPPAPLTSFSWNAPSPNLIVTSSIDTTCTIWDLPTRTALTQLIAHDREVYDVDWCPGSADVFASVGADGSVRVFDLRNLEHSTIIYETNAQSSMSHDRRSDSKGPGALYGGMGPSGMTVPLLRIAFNPWDANYLATFQLESNTVQILDVRAPGSSILELRGHSGPVNSVAWGPPSQGIPRNGPSKGMICTGGDDAQCLVYDLTSATLRTASAQGRRSRNSLYQRSQSPHDGWRVGAEVPVLAYTAPSMVNNVSWLGMSSASRHASHQSKHRSFYRNLLNEWTDYTSPSSRHGGTDWLALCAGQSVKVLRV